MNKTIIRVYLGHQIDDPTEKHVLSRLCQDLERRGIHARILANFIAGKNYRQIDLFIITSVRAVHCELKAYQLPIVARVNGPWQQVLPNRERRALDGNAFRQAQDGTYALSDDLRAFARCDQSVPTAPGGAFYKQIDTVVCLYPAALAGSHLEKHPYVTIVGYNQLLDRLGRPGPRPSWTDEQWDAFVRDRGLYHPDQRSVEERARDEGRALIEDYRRRFMRAYGDGLHELVPIGIDVDGQREGPSSVVKMATAQQTIVVVGPSGIGKSHLVQHAALDVIRDGHLVLWLRCAEYEVGKLDMLLARAVAPFITESPLEVIRIAREVGCVVVLVVDGLNECPEKWRSELLQELSALLLRVPAGVIITTQSVPTLPEPMSGSVVRLIAPTAEERLAILRSYGAEDLAPLCEAFTTPFELAIAAECASDLPKNPTRTELLDAYIRRRTDKTTVRTALRRIAAAMDMELRISLPIREVMWALQRGPDASLPSAVVDNALACPLLIVRHGRISFSHEHFTRFLAAEELVVHAEDGVALGRSLAQPHHADLRLHAIALEREPDRVRDAVAALADVSVMTAAIVGELGGVARDVVRSDASNLLAEATHATVSNDLWIKARNDSPAPLNYEWETSRTWSSAERALLAAIGRCLHHGYFAEQVLPLLESTDAICLAHLQDLRALGDRAPITSTVASVYVLPRTDMLACLPASLVVRACHDHRNERWRGSPRARARPARILVTGAGVHSWGRLYLAALLVDVRDRGEAEIVPNLLRVAWDTGAYHLRLEALRMAQDAAGLLDDAMRREVTAVLEQFETRHLILSTALVEALAAYDAIEPATDLEQICGQIEQLLAREDDPDAWKAAQHVALLQFEEDRVFGPYFEAINGLHATDRRRLLVMAARGSSPGDFGTGWIVREVIDSGDPDDPRVRGVLVKFASCMGPAQHFVQEAVSTHLAALGGCARFCDAPPPLDVEESDSADLDAWRRIDALVFGIERERVHGQSDQHATGLWETILSGLARAAVDVLYRMDRAGIMDDDDNASAHARLVAAYPGEVRQLLEWGLTNRDSLTSYFGRSSQLERDERDSYIVRTLGIVGNAATATLLRRYVLDPTLGEAAVAAIWQLERGSAVLAP